MQKGQNIHFTSGGTINAYKSLYLHGGPSTKVTRVC